MKSFEAEHYLLRAELLWDEPGPSGMRKSLESYTSGTRSSIDLVEQRLGSVSVLAKGVDTAAAGADKRERRRGS